MLRDSLLSVQSDHSSTSDEEKRRSGSAERYIIGQHSPEHSHVSGRFLLERIEEEWCSPAFQYIIFFRCG